MQKILEQQHLSRHMEPDILVIPKRSKNRTYFLNLRVNQKIKK